MNQVNQVNVNQKSQNSAEMVRNVGPSQDQMKLKMVQEKYRQIKRENEELAGEVNKLKYALNILKTQKKNLERECARMVPKKVAKLRVDTWNIFKVSTKKIRKETREIIIDRDFQPVLEEEIEEDNKGYSEKPVQIEEVEVSESVERSEFENMRSRGFSEE